VKDHPALVPRWPFLLFRGTTAGLGSLSVVQAGLAGGFLSGHYDVLRAHLVTAMVMEGVSIVQAVAVVFVRRSGGPRWVLWVGLLVPVLVAAQGGLGLGRVLTLHVPLGVLLAVGLLRLAAWAWRTPLPARPRDVSSARDNQPVGASS
jgi:hypothetical protein